MQSESNRHQLKPSSMIYLSLFFQIISFETKNPSIKMATLFMILSWQSVSICSFWVF